MNAASIAACARPPWRCVEPAAGRGRRTRSAGRHGPPPSRRHKKAAAKAPAAPIIEAGAVEWLKAASDRLAAAKTMSFTAIASYEFPSRLGPPILYTMRYDVALQRPDQLKIVMPGDGPATEFSFDGKEIVAFAPAQNLVAVAAAPPTIEGALKLAYQVGFGVLPVHRPAAARPLRRNQPGGEAGLRHRNVGRGRRHATRR